MADYLPTAFIDAAYATPTQPRRSTRTLSIEGRKLSQINVPPNLGSHLATLQENLAHGVEFLLQPPKE